MIQLQLSFGVSVFPSPPPLSLGSVCDMGSLLLSFLFYLCHSLSLSLYLSTSPSCVRPTRHYTVFLSEDSSGDELQHEDDSIASFPENFLFSAPFEWSPLYAALLPMIMHSLHCVVLLWLAYLRPARCVIGRALFQCFFFDCFPIGWTRSLSAVWVKFCGPSLKWFLAPLPANIIICCNSSLSCSKKKQASVRQV